MIYDIKDLDDKAMRMKACWKKARNFISTFAGDYFEVVEELKTGRYGNDWNYHKWLLLKIGTTEEVVLHTLKAFERALAADQRAAVERRKVARVRERREETARVRAEREAAKKQQEEEKAQREAQKKRELKNKKDRQRRAAQKKTTKLITKRPKEKLLRHIPDPVPTSQSNDIGHEWAEKARALIEVTRSSEIWSEARSKWIEASISLAEVLGQAREHYKSDHEFSNWLLRENLSSLITSNSRAALIAMSRDLPRMRRVLEQTKRSSWRLIYAEEFNFSFTPAVKPLEKAQISERLQ